MPAADVIVVGLGAMGSAAAFALAQRGYRVLGLDRFAPGHDRGSSHGKTRIIRTAYYESPEYVPLIRRAWTLWRELEALSGRPLLRLTGGLYIGRPETELVRGTLASARQHGLAHELLDAGEAMRRFPGLRLAPDQVAVYEEQAGLIDPEAAVAALQDLARGAGAELRHSTPVETWSFDRDEVQVETPSGTFRAGRAIIAAGAWMGQLVPELAPSLTVWRILHVHFAPIVPDRYDARRFPFALWEDESGLYSAFPELPGQGVKFGRHDSGEPCTPETARRTVTEGEIAILRETLRRYWPDAGGPVLWYLTCLYTMTPDHHFVIDRHPANPNVIVCSACSGHGFKFAPAIGELLADLATDPHRTPPSLFRLKRFSDR
ncbi:N-methyl-L-tryptophan oxidase [Thermomicrobium sp. 4228-Ro]|uniref:N-methyl-L-tryptophan oxidase n=1 Tax=Thermomicrobium sp. 4228-Ro TaxID=2993937 RepID=UPI0022493759|nr:N-methyl-L-tryptophan oxidase [Thermomicrobium sp. 4228-Ro]MCX2728052.1 N-methyl-L-tryptophan oxidase [Thermomicrobium sp. 4228-Ro]